MEEFLTIREAAARKGVAPSTIYNAIERGDIDSVNVLGRIAVRPADLDKYEPGSYAGTKRHSKPRGKAAGKAATQAPAEGTP